MQKKGFKLFALVGHAVSMARRNLKSYALLSVTITMSFSLLLGYLVYSDSVQYNAQKFWLRSDPHVARLQDSEGSNTKLTLLMQRLEQMEQTYSYYCYYTNMKQTNISLCTADGTPLHIHNLALKSLSGNVFGLYELGIPRKIDWLPGEEREGVILQQGEAVMDALYFKLLGLDKQSSPVYEAVLSGGSTGEPVYLKVNIVGLLYKDVSSVELQSSEDELSLKNYTPEILVSAATLGPGNTPEHIHWNREVFFYTGYPEQLLQIAGTIYRTNYDTGTETGSIFFSFQKLIEDSMENMRQGSRVKAIIAGALFLLLGINLYSCFTNALNNRKFEIGVKRAIGASAWEIVRQFLYESILIMIANILLSIGLVANIATVYKYLQENILTGSNQYEVFTIYFSPHSIAMFLVCSVGLTLIFSLVFAYKSTQVQVVDYLKAE